MTSYLLTHSLSPGLVGQIDEEMLSDLWLEAVLYLTKGSTTTAATDANIIDANKRQQQRSASSSAVTSNAIRNQDLQVQDIKISYDIFLRLNFRLNELIEEVDEAIQNLSPGNI